jgi:hypothetical protein
MDRIVTISVVAPLTISVPLYVLGWFPPDKQDGEKHPPHEHVEITTSTMHAFVGHPYEAMVAEPTNVRPGTSWPVKS